MSSCTSNSRRKESTTDKLKEEGMCRDCTKTVLKEEKGIEYGMCAYWMHTKCQDVKDSLYKALKDNADAGIQWHCSHLWVIANRVVAKVSKVAPNYQEMERRVKELDTQIKAKANEADLSELKRGLKAYMTSSHIGRPGKPAARGKHHNQGSDHQCNARAWWENTKQGGHEKISRRNWRQAKNQTGTRALKVKSNPNNLNRAAKHLQFW